MPLFLGKSGGKPREPLLFGRSSCLWMTQRHVKQVNCSCNCWGVCVCCCLLEVCRPGFGHTCPISIDGQDVSELFVSLKKMYCCRNKTFIFFKKMPIIIVGPVTNQFLSLCHYFLKHNFWFMCSLCAKGKWEKKDFWKLASRQKSHFATCFLLFGYQPVNSFTFLPSSWLLNALCSSTASPPPPSLF